MSNGQPENIRYGCVLFDDPNEHQFASAAKAGEPAKRIRGTRDLDSDHIWITNLSYDQILKSGFKRHARFRSDGFLRVSVDRILELHNISDLSRGAEMIATLADRVSRITYDFCQIGYEPGREIKQMIRESFQVGNDPVIPDWACMALKDATEYFTSCERPVNQFMIETNPADLVKFQVPPMLIAQHVLALDLPYGSHWEKVHSSRMGKTNFSSFDDLYKAVGGPFLARATVTDINETYNAILNYGSQPAFKSRRLWMSSTELEALWDITKVEIHEFIIPKDHAPYLLPYLERLLDLPVVCQSSLSYRLFMDNLWCAAGTNCRPAIWKAVPYSLINPATPFVRALEREICMNLAILLINYGLEVTGYGAGHIMVRLNGETPDQLFEAAVRSGTIPPMMPGANIVQEIDSPLKGIQQQYINGMTDTIMKYDEKITGMIDEQRRAG